MGLLGSWTPIARGIPALSMRLITTSKGKGERADVDNFTVTGIE